jgi:predicted Ser/Thr protein kinase
VSLEVEDPQTGLRYACTAERPLTVGRLDVGHVVDVACQDPHVSRRHCELRLAPDGRVVVTDTSSYGTFINGARVQGSGVARAGDLLVLGHEYSLAILAPALEAAAQTQLRSETPPTSRTAIGTPPASLLPDQEGATAPQRVGRYTVGEEIGRGGMGVVYKATCNETKRDVALKVIHGFTEEEVKARFEREARLAAKLGDYPAIVKVRDWGVAGPSVLFLAMDYVDGVPLTTALREGLERRIGVKLVARVARAVHYAHEQGVIHRDLKPDNVLVTKGDQVRLTDFGIAKESGSKITLTGMAMGTPNYMAPEQLVDSKRAGPAADVYGLGGLLYAVLTLRPPIVGKNISKIIRQVQSGKVDPPRVWTEDLDPDLEEICLKALDFEPERRHESADALARELEAWLKGSDGEGTSVHLQLPGR